MIRARNNTVRLPASPMSSEEMALPASVMRITGLRPTRSDSLPHTGAKITCINE